MSLAETAIPIIPWPELVQRQEGVFTFSKGTRVVLNKNTRSLKALGELASQLLKPLTGRAHSVVVNQSASGLRQAVRITLDEEAVTLGPEGYRLHVTPEWTCIDAPHEAGLFYGLQSLLQLLPQPGPERERGRSGDVTIPCVLIEDRPRYVWRGLMLDVSRHWCDTATLLRLLDAMALHKFNRLHLNLTGDSGWRVEIRRYPALIRVGAVGTATDRRAPAQFYTQREIRELVEAAAQRQIVVVPGVDMPGHAGAAIRSYSDIGCGHGTFHPAKKGTYTFLENVLTEVMELFPSPCVHLGCAEVNRKGWEQDGLVRQRLEREKLNDTFELEGLFMRRMTDYVTRNGRRPIVFDEAFATGVDPSVIVQWWRHDKPELRDWALEEGHDLILSPRAPLHFDCPQFPGERADDAQLLNTLEAVYNWTSTPEGIDEAAEQRILGVQANVWTTPTAAREHLEPLLLPRLAALAERAWSPAAPRPLEDFRQRLAVLRRRYAHMGLGCAPLAGATPS